VTSPRREFDMAVTEIMKRRGMSKSEAFEAATTEYPALHAAFSEAA
jgi:hypothetical protein